jgi:hypothetical protein
MSGIWPPYTMMGFYRITLKHLTVDQLKKIIEHQFKKRTYEQSRLLVYAWITSVKLETEPYETWLPPEALQNFPGKL